MVQIAEDMLPRLMEPGCRDGVTAALTKLLAGVNGEIEAFEKLGFIVIVKDRWTIEAGLLTPTMKIKRSSIEDLYKDKLDGWYAAGKKVIWEQ